MRLIFPSGSVVVVAGVPGAGKTTLIRRAVDRAAVRVVDTEDRREEGGHGVARLYAGHYARIAWAIAGRRPAVIHSRGTHAAARKLIAAMIALRRRSAHLVLIDADRPSAEAGQRARGRAVGQRAMNRQLARWQRLAGTVRADRGPRFEGWRSVTLMDRAEAARVEAFEFALAPGRGPAGHAAICTAAPSGSQRTLPRTASGAFASSRSSSSRPGIRSVRLGPDQWAPLALSDSGPPRT